jgi:hypothetical protein
MNSVGTAGSSLHGWRNVHARLQYGGLVDGGRLPRPATLPVTLLAAGFAHSSTVENARKWQRLYPDKTEFTQICSGKYPTYVVGNYKSKKSVFSLLWRITAIS